MRTRQLVRFLEEIPGYDGPIACFFCGNLLYGRDALRMELPDTQGSSA